MRQQEGRHPMADAAPFMPLQAGSVPAKRDENGLSVALRVVCLLP
jgi:hypothetical protein